MKLSGRRALITGASRGLGEAIAEAFLVQGASLMLCARNAHQLEDSRRRLAARAAADQRVVAMPADVSVPAEVDRLIARAVEDLGGLDVLVCNAGVYGPKGPIEAVDWEEWVRALHINLLGTVYPCRAVVPLFKARGSGKIVVLSGGGATSPLPRLSAYAASKAAVVRFAETLAVEVQGLGIDVNAIAPGALNTRMLDEVLEAGPDTVGAAFYERAVKQKAQGGTPLERGASLCVFLASAASDGITGRLVSAVWDPWESLPTHAAELRDSDVYTLRRIVPEDRGKQWGERA
jgi:3-oxoacyl-[acyl-carrier protein] reductase